MEVKNLKKSYNGNWGLPFINLNVGKGEILTISGSNGSGKTTLSNLITGLLEPDSGVIKYGFSGDPFRSIGYAPESVMLWPRLTPSEHIFIISAMYKIVDTQTAPALIDLLALKKYRNIPVSKLSSGNRKKLNFILAVLHNPLLLILDEPFNSLDMETTKKLINWLKAYVKSGDRSVIITTNRPDIIEAFNKKIITLDRIKND